MEEKLENVFFISQEIDKNEINTDIANIQKAEAIFLFVYDQTLKKLRPATISDI